jgi:peptidyl-dipeptidase Dcp
MQQMIEEEGNDFELQSWDWWYYAEKIRKQKYDLDDAEIRPYFELNNVREGAFILANKLWGLNFEEINNVPLPHPDAKSFEVTDADGSFIGIYYADYYPRESKRGGAWMSSYRKQYRTENGEFVHPVITNVTNFSKPTGDKPALLSFDEVTTLFHEFGHGLHGLLSDCKYHSLSGTSTPRDFVELPSQIMENWCAEPEMLKLFAKHYETGEVIPQELIDKLVASSQFNQGFETVEYLAASFLDMDYHTTKDVSDINIEEFEEKSMDKIGLIDEIIPRYKSTYFNHIWASGYSAGYYSYIWAEVLDADAFNYFVESGDIFNKEIAASFRENILSKGGTGDAMTMYKTFRGQEPSIEPLLKKRGLK